VSTKRCRDCERDLALTEFYRNRDTADGLLSRCKNCYREYAKGRKHGDGTPGKRKAKDRVDDRIGDWLIARGTLSLGDIITADEIVQRLGIKPMTLRWWRSRGGPYGLDFPDPVYRPESTRGIWLRAEVEEFERKYKAAKAVKRKRPGEGT
jgi:hypothetical protein